MSGGDEEAAVLHDLFGGGIGLVVVFEPDVEAEADDIDVSAGAPGCASVFAIGVAEGDVDAGKFLVLKNVADDAGDADVGADGELANAVGILVGVRVGPEVLFELLVGAGAGDDAVLRDVDGERSGLEQAVAGAEPIANDSVDDKGAIDFAGRGEAFAAGEIAPFFRRDDPRGLEPFIVRIHVGHDAGAGCGGGADADGAADAIKDLLRKLVDDIEVGAHAIAHNLGRDVDHVRVAHAAAVDDVGHLHAGTQFIGLNLDGEDGDGGGFHIIEDRGGHVGKRTGREVFEDECVEGAAAFLELGSDGGGDGFGDAVGDERDLLVGLNAQTSEYGGAGAGRELSRVGLREQVGRGCGKACDDDAPIGDS